MAIRFHNRGGRCALRGYPGVDGLRHGHAVVHARRTRRGYLAGAPVRTVTLRHGRTASATLEGASGPYPGRRCRRYRALRITPPNETHSIRRRVRAAFCYPEVHPVVHGRSGTKRARSAAGGPLTHCSSGQLRVGLRSYGGAAGTGFYLVVLRNQTGHRCSTGGYPGVSLLGGHRHRIGEPAARGKARPRRIVLAPGHAASAELTVRANLCGAHPRMSRYVRVFPPGNRRALLVRGRLVACKPGVGRLYRGTPPPSARHGRTSVSEAAVARCHRSQLRVRFQSITGAAGTEHGDFDVRNVSGSRCSLFGYPGLQMRATDNRPLPTHLARGGVAADSASRRVKRVALRPRRAAHFDLTWSAQCPVRRQVTPAQLRVTPPGAFRPRRVGAQPAGGGRMIVCGGNLTTSAVFARYRTTG
jgi:hypothetical protein